MPSLLPLLKSPRLTVKSGLPGTASLDRYDAVLLLLPTDARPSRALPNAGRWQTLHARGEISHADVRMVTLDNPRQTLGVLGYCRSDADAFELLRVAGLLAQRAYANRPDPVRIAIIVQPPLRQRAAWQEALYAALAAHCFPLPTDKPAAARRKVLAAIDVFGDSALDRARAERTAEATNLVRHLTALPPNVLDATAYRRLLGMLARRHGLRLRWYTEAALARLGAGAFLAVSRGNPRRDAGIAQLTYQPRRKRTAAGTRPDLALVGKGVLFDTGGTNLKPHRSMLDMHTDMAGSAVALATIVAAAQLRVPYVIDAWLAITENNIGPKSYRPQEVVRAMNGTTIQVIHSDAEGRMALADTLALAARRRPLAMVDFATLTGACVYALTERMSGLFSTDATLAQRLLAASAQSGERLWQFPLPDDFDTDLESLTADIAQCAVEGKGDHILATRFLKRFVPNDIAWAHIDLSSATRRGGLAHVPSEITGFGARLTLALLLDHPGKR
ncbi:MAG: M17 family metallopeptidase [Steroidobacteraceae bacterium]